MDAVQKTSKLYAKSSALVTLARPENPLPSPHFLDLVLKPLKLADGTVAAILMLGWDVTDRVIAEQELMAREADLRQTLDALPLGIITFDRFSVVRMVNEHFALTRGMQVDEFIGQHLRDLVGETIYALRRPIVQSILAGETKEFIEVRRAADGKLHRYYQKYFPRRHRGEIVGFYGTTMDITAYMALPEEPGNIH